MKKKNKKKFWVQTTQMTNKAKYLYFKPLRTIYESGYRYIEYGYCNERSENVLVIESLVKNVSNKMNFKNNKIDMKLKKQNVNILKIE